MTQTRTMAAVAMCIAATAALTGMDLGSKAWAADNLSTERSSPVAVCEGEPQRIPSATVEIVEEHLRLSYAENCAGAFGFMSDQSKVTKGVVFGVAGLIGCTLFFWMFWRGKGSRFFAWSVPFVVSGAIGNMVDRAALGYVVDFIAFRIGDWHYPTFNIADATILIGVVLFLLDAVGTTRAESRGDNTSSPS